jgi:hypothetical protein
VANIVAIPIAMAMTTIALRYGGGGTTTFGRLAADLI